MGKDDTIIKIDDVTRVYNINRGRKKEKFTALKDFSLEVKDGDFVTIVGPSGCGKSTLLDLLAGLAFPESGTITIDDKIVTGPALDRGFVMQSYALFPWRTIGKNVQFGLEIKKVKKSERREITKKYLELVGLEGLEDRYPYELSGGMKQRVALARAFAFEPRVLLMDEPFAAVDAQTRELLQEELLRIWEKTHKTIIFITHSIEEAVFLGQKAVVISNSPGRVKEIIDVDIPGERKAGDVKSSASFNWIVHKVWNALHDVTDETEAQTDAVNVGDEIEPNTAL
jgi:NitT/TauT family transport system ATP-binding protein